jgi:hypothetical protein
MLTVIACYNNKGDLSCQEFCKKKYLLEVPKFWINGSAGLFYWLKCELLPDLDNDNLLSNSVNVITAPEHLSKPPRSAPSQPLDLNWQSSQSNALIPHIRVPQALVPPALAAHKTSRKKSRYKKLLRRAGKLMSFTRAFRLAIAQSLQSQWTPGDYNFFLQHLLSFQAQLFLWQKMLLMTPAYKTKTKFNKKLKNNSNHAIAILDLAIKAINVHRHLSFIKHWEALIEKLTLLVKLLQHKCPRRLKRKLKNNLKFIEVSQGVTHA